MKAFNESIFLNGVAEITLAHCSKIKAKSEA